MYEMETPVANEKYTAIIKTGHDLFWKFGIRRVTIEEICREANVSKMTFYRFFSNKTEIAMAVVTNLFDEMIKDYRKLMDEEIPFEEKIKKQLLMKFEGTKEISPELIKDIYGDPSSELFKYWKSRADGMLQLVYEDYSHAQKMGWIRKDIKLEYIIYMSNKASELVSDENLQKLYPDMQSLIMEYANMFFYGILPRL
jgi:AcrR family transcriptional regulator